MRTISDSRPGSTSTHNTPHLISVAEAAKRLTISVRSLRTLVACGELPVVRVSARRIAVLEADLVRYIDVRRSRVPQ